MLRVSIFSLILFLPLAAYAQEVKTWQEANRLSSEHYAAGLAEDAALMAQRAAALYPVQSKT